MTSAPTQAPSTVVAQASILTSATTAPIPPPTDTTTVPPMTWVFRPTTEIVSVHKIDSDSDQEDEQPLE